MEIYDILYILFLFSYLQHSQVERRAEGSVVDVMAVSVLLTVESAMPVSTMQQHNHQPEER